MTPRTSVILGLLAAFSTVPLLFGTAFPGFEFLIVPIFLFTILAARGLGQVEREFSWAIPTLLLVGAVLSIVSVFTGFLNGFSDEPYSTPAYGALGWQMYSQPVTFYYWQYGTAHFLDSYNVYLPLLTYVQIPGLDYRWVSLFAWVGMLYLLRDRPIAIAGLAAPWIPLLAANGQNDYVPLLALTIALVVRLGRWQIVAEVFALALKQLANVVIVLYHLVRREFFRAALAVAITAAILAPFFFLDPSGVYCHVLLGDPSTNCTGRPFSFFIFKRNYWLYPTWIVVVFYEPLRDRAVALTRRYLPSVARRMGIQGPVEAPEGS